MRGIVGSLLLAGCLLLQCPQRAMGQHRDGNASFNASFLFSPYIYMAGMRPGSDASMRRAVRPRLGPYPMTDDFLAPVVVKTEPLPVISIADTTALPITDADTAITQFIPPGVIIPNVPIVSGRTTGQITEEMRTALKDLETEMLIEKFAEMTERSPDDMENFPLYRFIDDWYGVRYKYGGNDNRGIDCSGFSQKLYGSIYSLKLLRTARQQRHNCSLLIKHHEDATEGDLVFFRIHRMRISHVGVYLANGYFVHASRSRGVMISSLQDKYWRRRYAGCGHMEREGIITESGLEE